MPYIYRISRRLNRQPQQAGVSVPVTPEPAVVTEEVSYRDLQAQAKALEIPANQSADDLKKAIEDANG